MLIFKQYGKQRTGTNYVRGVIERSFSDVRVLSSILGWKHGLHQDHLKWIEDHTVDGRIVFDRLEMPYTPKQLKDWVVRDRIRYVISWKEPEAFIASFARYRGRDLHKTGWVVQQCIDYNEKYSNWLRLYRESPARGFVFAHHHLVDDFDRVMAAFRDRFKLSLKAPAPVNPTDRFEKGDDRHAARTEPVPFDAFYWRNRQYLKALPDKARKAIDDTIDRKLVEELEQETMKCISG